MIKRPKNIEKMTPEQRQALAKEWAADFVKTYEKALKSLAQK